jgi:hypothetical protein
MLSSETVLFASLTVSMPGSSPTARKYMH